MDSLLLKRINNNNNNKSIHTYTSREREKIIEDRRVFKTLIKKKAK